MTFHSYESFGDMIGAFPMRYLARLPLSCRLVMRSCMVKNRKKSGKRTGKGKTIESIT